MTQSILQVGYAQATRMATACIKAGLVPNVLGSPGIGKSQIAKDIAAEHNLQLIDIRLSQCDPTDLMGFPTTTGKKAGYLPMETFPIETDSLPTGKSGWLIFLDEANSAPQAVQAAAYKLLLDRMVGVHRLHTHVAMMCAGNLETDNAIVMPTSTALQSRMVHMELVPVFKEWRDWASSIGLDHRIVDYLGHKPKNLFTFAPDHSDRTYGCPRTWHFAHRLLEIMGIDNPDILPLLSGTLGEGLAREFLVFCKIYNEIPKLAQIEADPQGTPVPQEPSYLYAITGSVAQHASVDNFKRLMQYIHRLPKEFQVVTMRDATRRNTALKAHPATEEWLMKNALELF